PHISHLSPSYFNDSATPEIYTLSLHDALPISGDGSVRQSHDHVSGHLCAAQFDPGSLQDQRGGQGLQEFREERCERNRQPRQRRSEEHTSELQSRGHLVCRLLLEKKKKKNDHQ